MTKILVVDDSKVVGKLISNFLATFYHQVLVVQTVDEAVASLKEHGSSIRIVITDLIMPGRDGMELIDHIHKTMIPFDRPKIIAISGGSKGTVNAQTALQSIRDRVDRVLEKPFKPLDLTGAVADLIAV